MLHNPSHKFHLRHYEVQEQPFPPRILISECKCRQHNEKLTVLPAYDYFAASNIFSMKIPYPLVGSFTKTWVTAPTIRPF